MKRPHRPLCRGSPTTGCDADALAVMVTVARSHVTDALGDTCKGAQWRNHVKSWVVAGVAHDQADERSGRTRSAALCNLIAAGGLVQLAGMEQHQRQGSSTISVASRTGSAIGLIAIIISLLFMVSTKWSVILLEKAARGISLQGRTEHARLVRISGSVPSASGKHCHGSRLLSAGSSVTVLTSSDILPPNSEWTCTQSGLNCS